ncbi:MAG: glycosyltransferase family 39 protein [Nitrospinae bacterium]|nr:glycosyltransferase family 39 protein [Nitrospinota bacterium]
MMQSGTDNENYTSEKGTQSTLLYCVAFILLSLYQLLFIRYGLNIWDEGVLLNGVLRTIDGETAMKDFIGYPPGRYMWAKFFTDIFGLSIFSIRLSLVPLTSLMVLAVFVITKKITNNSFAFIASAMLLSTPAVYYNRYFTIFSVFILFFLVRWIENPKQNNTIYLLLSIIFTTIYIKVEVGVLSLTAFVLIYGVKSLFDSDLKVNYQKIAITIMLISFLLIILSFNIDLLTFLKYFYSTVFEVFHLWGNPFPELSEILPTNKDFFDNLHFYLSPLLSFITILFFINKTELLQERKHLILFAVLVFALFMNFLVVWRAGYDNLLRTLPSYYILVSWVLYKTYEYGRKHFSLEKGLYKGALFGMLLLYPATFIFHSTVNHGFYSGSIGELFREHVPYDSQFGRVYIEPHHLEPLNFIITTIKENSTENDTIFAAPINPLWSFFSGRKNASYFEFVLPSTLTFKKDKNFLLKELREKKPKLAIISDISIDGKEDRKFRNYEPEIFNFFLSHYLPIAKVGTFIIFLIRE